MEFITYFRNQYLSWSQNTPLPANLDNVSPKFQSWHQFDPSDEKWTSVHVTNTHIDSTRRETEGQSGSSLDSKFFLVTWNVDSSSALPVERMSAIVSNVANLTPTIDILFFQEVSRQALQHLLADAYIRQFWYSSEADDANWQGQSFASMTLLSRRRFDHGDGPSATAAKLGPLWRLKYSSRFGRDALCCDIFVPSRAQSSLPGNNFVYARVRLINVHLDSLPIKPSKRPQQVSTVASLLRCTNRGLVAGDFNPVLPEDDTLVADNHLVDAWLELRGNESGFTWGVDGQAPFPPARLDKVALLGLRPHSMDLVHPEKIKLRLQEPEEGPVPGNDFVVSDESRKTQEDGQAVPWSDHSGLKCSFALVCD